MVGKGVSKKLNSLCKILNIDTDTFCLETSEGLEVIAKKIIVIFENNPTVYHRFLYNRIYERIERELLLNFFPEKNSIKEGDSIEELLPAKYTKSRIQFLERKTTYILPRPVLPKFNLIIMLLLFIVPLGITLTLFLFNIDLLGAVIGIIRYGFIAFIIGIPYIVAYFFFPKFFEPNMLKGISTYKDLVDNTALLNSYIYLYKEKELLEQEILNYLQS